MKRLIWVSLLLVFAAVLMPVLFIQRELGGKNSGAVPTPGKGQAVELPRQTAPQASPTAGQALGGLSDAETWFTVLDGGEIRRVSMAEHLPGVLGAEMPASFAPDALKAQAVAARTYILYCTKHENPKHPDGDICSDGGCCLAYLDEGKLRAAWGESFDANLKIINAAVSETDGQVLTFEEEPILASFHSSSAGKTESGSELWGEVPYLVSVPSPETAVDVPGFVSTVEVSQEEFRKTVQLLRPEAQLSGGAADWLGKADRDDSGRVRSVKIGGSQLTGSEVRKLFSLRSTAFRIEFKNDIFVFTVSGYGHGLGLSQYGANVMAKGGFNYREILAHYYPHTKLS
ncbi:MAG: stage II sporulation protein D [Oscillospiraceae bacterium]